MQQSYETEEKRTLTRAEKGKSRSLAIANAAAEKSQMVKSFAML